MLEVVHVQHINEFRVAEAASRGITKTHRLHKAVVCEVQVCKPSAGLESLHDLEDVHGDGAAGGSTHAVNVEAPESAALHLGELDAVAL